MFKDETRVSTIWAFVLKLIQQLYDMLLSGMAGRSVRQVLEDPDLMATVPQFGDQYLHSNVAR